MKIGTHRARCLGGVLTETKGNARREYVFLKFALVEDKNDVIGWQGYFGDNVDKGGKTLTERTVDVLRCCGWEGDDVSDLTGVTRNEVEIVVMMDDYNGQQQLKCRFVQPIGTAAAYMPDQLPASRAKSFAERIRQRIRGEKPSYGGYGQRSSSPPPDDGGFPPPSDDDIPF